MKRLVSAHAEDIGGSMVEPGAEFDEADADPALLERLEADGKVVDMGKSAAKSTKKEGGGNA